MMTMLVTLCLGTAPVHELALFSVQKSDNRNEVVYFVSVDAACALASDRPVTVRWHMRERGENVWEELLAIERPIYALGEQVAIDAHTVATFARAAPEHAFVVTVAETPGGCTAHASLSRDGQLVEISNVSVELGLLSVKRATLFGRSLPTGRPVMQRLQ
jgi:hypothetical protein